MYEETVLTWRDGGQMVGFAMAHGAFPLVFLAGLIGLPCALLWIAVSLILLIRKKFRIPVIDWVPIALLSILAALLFTPYETWEELAVRIAGPGLHGSNFLVQAAAQDKLRFVKLLLNKGYDINYEDPGGTTPLSGAANGGHEEMVAFLISRGADVNRRDGLTGETALLSAAEMGQLGTVKLLLKNGANPCSTDNDGRTAAGLAKKYGHGNIAEYLSSRFHCQEKVTDLPCVDSAVSVCVH